MNQDNVKQTVKERQVALGAIKEAMRDLEESREPITVENLYSRAVGFATWADCKRYLEEEGYKVN